jgi:peptidyl-prolyl cis-trans isomerase SurA
LTIFARYNLFIMKLKTIVLNAFFILLTQFIDAQTSDPVLFSVHGNPVKVSEFEYIYNKNNGKDANFTKASLDEYLNLYTRFKLKVQAARDMKLGYDSCAD